MACSDSGRADSIVDWEPRTNLGLQKVRNLLKTFSREYVQQSVPLVYTHCSIFSFSLHSPTSSSLSLSLSLPIIQTLEKYFLPGPTDRLHACISPPPPLAPSFLPPSPFENKIPPSAPILWQAAGFIQTRLEERRKGCLIDEAIVSCYACTYV